MPVPLETLKHLGAVGGEHDIEKLGGLTRLSPDTLAVLGENSRKFSPRTSLEEFLVKPFSYRFGPRNRRRRRF